VLRIERIVARFTRDHDLDQMVSMLLEAIKGVGIAVVIIIGVNFRATKLVTAVTMETSRPRCEEEFTPRRYALRSANAERGRQSKARDGWARDSGEPAFRLTGR